MRQRDLEKHFEEIDRIISQQKLNDNIARNIQMISDQIRIARENAQRVMQLKQQIQRMDRAIMESVKNNNLRRAFSLQQQRNKIQSEMSRIGRINAIAPQLNKKIDRHNALSQQIDARLERMRTRELSANNFISKRIARVKNMADRAWVSMVQNELMTENRKLREKMGIPKEQLKREFAKMQQKQKDNLKTAKKVQEQQKEKQHQR